VGKSGPMDKPFVIPKQLVWEAYKQVKRNKGAAGVDGVSVEEFEADLKNNLYRIWNRMSSGTYFPPPVKAVEIPKQHGTGTRTLGVPTVADRIAQTVVALALEARTESIFHTDSYGYRPGSHHLMRCGSAASGVGRRTGSSTLISRNSLTRSTTTSWSSRSRPTLTRSGLCCMWNDG
jgi:RNA-directed DNA polymerase